MKVRAAHLGSALILFLEGRLTAEADMRQVNDATRAIKHGRITRVVLDLAKVDRIDCSGIGQLVRLHNTARRSGYVFVLLNVNSWVRRLLDVAGLLAVFPAVETLREAIVWCEPLVRSSRAMRSASRPKTSVMQLPASRPQDESSVNWSAR